MDDEKYEKALKNAKWVALVILVLVIIIFILQMVSGQMKTVTMISGIIQMALLIATAYGMKQKEMYGPICGVIVSILLILSLDIISLIIGICYLFDNINIMRKMKDN
jgi:hypothetical protein